MSRNIVALSRVKACIENRASAVLWCNGQPTEFYKLITQDVETILSKLHLHALIVSASLHSASQQAALTVLELAATCMPGVTTTEEMKAILETTSDEHDWNRSKIARLLLQRGICKPHWLTETQLQVVLVFDVFMLSAKALSLLDATLRAIRGTADVDIPMGSGVSVIGVGDPYDNRSDTSAFGSKAVSASLLTSFSSREVEFHSNIGSPGEILVKTSPMLLLCFLCKWRRLFRRTYFAWTLPTDSMHTLPGQTVRKPKRILRRDLNAMKDALHYGAVPLEPQAPRSDQSFDATDGCPESTTALTLHSWPVPASLSLAGGDFALWIQEEWPQTPALLVEVVGVGEGEIKLRCNPPSAPTPDTLSLQPRTFKKRLFLGPETPAVTFSRTAFPLVSASGHQTTNSIKAIRPHKVVLHGTVTVSQAYQLRDVVELHIEVKGRVDTAVLDEDRVATRTFEACRCFSAPPRVGSKIKVQGIPGVHKIVASGDGVFPILFVEGPDKNTRQYFRYLMDYSYV